MHPHFGQILGSLISLFISYTPFADIECKPQIFQIKSEITIALNAGSHVGTAWNSQRSVLMHDVHESLDFSAVYGDFHFLFVVESRMSLISIKAVFIGFRNFPDCNRNFEFSVFSMVR